MFGTMNSERNRMESPGGGCPSKQQATLSSNQCQVPGCAYNCEDAKKYNQRLKICPAHLVATSLKIEGISQRFCQQCSKFHPLGDFDGSRRSCRMRLQVHNERRKRKRESKLLAALAQDDQSSGPGGSNGAACMTEEEMRMQFLEMHDSFRDQKLPPKASQLLLGAMNALDCEEVLEAPEGARADSVHTRSWVGSYDEGVGMGGSSMVQTEAAATAACSDDDGRGKTREYRRSDSDATSKPGLFSGATLPALAGSLADLLGRDGVVRFSDGPLGSVTIARSLSSGGSGGDKSTGTLQRLTADDISRGFHVNALSGTSFFGIRTDNP